MSRLNTYSSIYSELVIFLESEETQIDEGSAIGIIVRFEGQLAQGISISVNLEALTMDNAGIYYNCMQT